MGVEATLGQLPAAALCWLVAALAAATGDSEAVVSASEPRGPRGLCFPECPRDGETVMTKALITSPGTLSSPSPSLPE